MMSTPAFRYAAALYRTGCPVERLCETADYLTDSPPLWEALCSPVVEVREKTAVLARLPSFTEDVRLQHFYALLAEKGMEARQAIHEVSLCYATPAQAKALDVAPGDALLCLHEVIYDQSGHPLHTSHQVIRGDRFTFRI